MKTSRLRNWGLFSTVVTISIFALAYPALAGGPLALFQTGQPFLWPGGGANIPFNPDRGMLGTLNNAAAVAQTETAFLNWQNVPSATVTYVNAGLLPVDVDGTNFFPFVFPAFPDGLSAVVYDADGSIFNILFGPGSGILGFAGPEWIDPTTGNILEGVTFLNGGSILAGFPVGEFLDVQVHEFGHYTNMAHTVVNGQIAAFLDSTGPTPFDTFPPENLFNRIETMYPFIFIGGGMESPHIDDMAILSTLYPAPGFFANTGSVSGTIFAPNGTTKLTGVNVIGRNISNPFDDVVSAISSDFTDDFSQANPLTGVYTLNGLTPGAEYAVYVDQILAGGFSTPPSLIPGREEFHNGADESSDSATDDPSVFTPILVGAGSPIPGIDIVINELPPGAIPLGDDTFFELFPPFPFDFCGESFNSLFVNSNGSLTFGQGDPDFSESVNDHLDGPPRIAGFWDDLNPGAGGVVSFDQTGNTFTVTFTGVPEFPAVGANSFEITLLRSSNKIEINYGALSAPGGLAGLSCGNRVTSGLEGESDLTVLATESGETINARIEPAIYEAFTDFDNDLENAALRFNAPNAFKDHAEPNDSIVQATRVNLPFNSGDRFTEIRPEGGDIDFFRFRANLGETLIAETLPGNVVDTLIGLFDVSTGGLLAVNDDGGQGLLSRLVFSIPADGLYALAVTTFPDFGFTGAGGDEGRYILDLQTLQGTILNLGDDTSVEVPLETFEFPYQGTNWISVFVNSNGNLTFGSGDSDFSESISDFLGGPPRIAPLWDDLSPNNGGRVTVERTSGSLTINFEDVPEFFATGANSFSVTLESGGNVTIAYGTTNGNDGLVGLTEGNGATNPGETDLSAAVGLSTSGTTYEQFFPGQFDLDFLTLLWISP